jgi:hypothetical protein
MSDLIGGLRMEAVTARTFGEADVANLCDDAADRIEALEVEVQRLEKLGAIQDSVCDHRARVISEQDTHIKALEAKVKELERLIPDPDDLRLVLDAAEYVVKEYDTGPEPDMLAAAIASLRATLEEA